MNPAITGFVVRCFDTPRDSGRQSTVEGLRGLAMTMVFFGHFVSLFGHYLSPDSISSEIIKYLAVWGHRGISFFLVITGYFVYQNFLDRETEYLPFIRKRLARIFPLYWSMLGLYLVLSRIFPDESRLPHDVEHSLIYVLQNIFLLPAVIGRQSIIVVSWALTYLVLAYLTIPVLVRVLEMKRMSAWQRTLLIVVGALLWLRICALYANLSPRAVMIAVGILLYEALKRPAFVKKFNMAGEFAAVGLLVMGLTLWYLADLHYFWFLPPFVSPYFYRYLFLGVGMFYFSAYTFAYHGFLHRFLALPAMRWLGGMSYSYYLFHGVTLKGLGLAVSLLVIGRYSTSLFWCLLPAGYLLTLLTSRFLFVTVERPLAQPGVIRNLFESAGFGRTAPSLGLRL